MNQEVRIPWKPVDWSSFLERYRRGEWRAPIFCDMILAEIKSGHARPLTMLDIGCGKGFDDDPKFQKILSQACDLYVGVEPDVSSSHNPAMHHVYYCRFEEAPIEPSSINLAFSVMVLEHIESPEVFWDKLYNSLCHGGVFWGFTMDSRHPFANISVSMKNLMIKDWYLNRLHGRTGGNRYENFPVYYRSNKPDQIVPLASRFRSLTILNFHRTGQLDYYFPKALRWLGRAFDRYCQWRGLPGPIMAMRVMK